jgi:hypothetical protein
MPWLAASRSIFVQGIGRHISCQRQCRLSRGKEAPLRVTPFTPLRCFLRQCLPQIKPPLDATHVLALAPISAKNARDSSPVGKNGTDTSRSTSHTGSIVHPRVAPGEAIILGYSKSIGRTSTTVQFLYGSNSRYTPPKKSWSSSPWMSCLSTRQRPMHVSWSMQGSGSSESKTYGRIHGVAKGGRLDCDF